MQSQLEDQRLLNDDLAMEIEDEYNPMIPNSYEKVVRERREEHEKIREEEVSTLAHRICGACIHNMFVWVCTA